MLAHGLATNSSRATRCPVTLRVSSAPLGLISSLGFNSGCKEKVKLFIDVDRIHVKDPYQRLGMNREASEEEIRAARSFLVSNYAGHKPSVDAIESAHDRLIMQSFFDRKKPKMNLKKKI